jgi:hypothetical protein
MAKLGFWFVRAAVYAALCVLAVKFAMGFASDPIATVDGFEVSQFVLIVALTAISVSTILLTPNLKPKGRFTNHDIHTRARYLSELLRSAKRDLLIVTGEFDHHIYDHPLVLGALSAIPASASVEIFVTGTQIDPASERAIQLIRKRRWNVYYAPEKLGHVIIADRTNVRVEKPDGKSAPAFRHATYEYGAFQLADKLYQKVMRSVDYNRPYQFDDVAAATNEREENSDLDPANTGELVLAD